MLRTAVVLLLMLLAGCASQKDASKSFASGLRCPKCQEHAAVPVLYGFPGPEAVAAIERGEAVPGGCMVPGPSHYCRACGHEHD